MRSLEVLFLLFIVTTASNAQWVQATGPTGAGLNCLAADTVGHVYAASDSMWFRSTNNGDTWGSMSFTTPQWAGGKFCVGGDNILLAGTWRGISRSTNFGATWVGASLVDTSITAFSVGPDRTVYAGTAPPLPLNTWRGSIHRSKNNGVSWAQCAPTWAPTSVEAIAVTPSGSMFVAQTSHISLTGSVMRSTDAGLHWETVYECGRDTMIHALAAGPDGAIFVGTTSTDFGNGPGGKALRSTDDGQTWITLQGGLPEAPVWSFLFVGSTSMFLSTIGVYSSSDHGTTWVPAGTGLPLTSVYSLANSGNTLFAGTRKSGVWRIPLSEVTTVEEPFAAGTVHFGLSQNFPDPFNPSCVIRYELAVRSHVTLSVFNSLGQQIALLEDGEREAGSHEVRFDGGGLASGVYFYRIQAGTSTATKKMVFLR